MRTLGPLAKSTGRGIVRKLCAQIPHLADQARGCCTQKSPYWNHATLVWKKEEDDTKAAGGLSKSLQHCGCF